MTIVMERVLAWKILPRLMMIMMSLSAWRVVEWFMTLPEPTISKTEWELKDELIRNTIMDTQDHVEMILEKLDKLDERIYEIQKQR